MSRSWAANRHGGDMRRTSRCARSAADDRELVNCARNRWVGRGFAGARRPCAWENFVSSHSACMGYLQTGKYGANEPMKVAHKLRVFVARSVRDQARSCRCSRGRERRRPASTWRLRKARACESPGRARYVAPARWVDLCVAGRDDVHNIKYQDICDSLSAQLRVDSTMRPDRGVRVARP
ncbi:hypothetical protein BD413DRAFT_157697 [Trametes elegans]|nr:hypothetical protein BD413DRAFT_157697 [Trametes elegans]